MNKSPESSSSSPEVNTGWDSLTEQSNNDFAGETNLNSKTGKPRTFTTFDIYPKMPGESNEDYGARLKFMQEKNAEFQAAEAAKEQALKEQQARDAYLQSEQGQQETKINADFDRISDKLDQAIAEGRMSSEHAERLREKSFNQANEEIDGIRQDYLDRQSIGTPEEQARYQEWLQAHDVKDDSPSQAQDANDGININTAPEPAEATNTELTKPTNAEPTPSTTINTAPEPDKPSFKKTSESPWLRYEDEEERMRKEWESMVGLDEFVKSKAHEYNDPIMNYNQEHEAEMRQEWERITGLEEYKKNLNTSPDTDANPNPDINPDTNSDSNPDTNPDSSPTTDDDASGNQDAGTKRHRDPAVWLYEFVQKIRRKDKANASPNDSYDNLSDADKEILKNTNERLSELLGVEIPGMIKKAMGLNVNTEPTSSNADQASPNTSQVTPNASQDTPNTEKGQKNDNPEERRKDYLKVVDALSQGLGEENAKILKETGQRASEYYQGYWDSLDQAGKSNVYKAMLVALPETAEGKGFRDWFRAAGINPNGL